MSQFRKGSNEELTHSSSSSYLHKEPSHRMYHGLCSTVSNKRTGLQGYALTASDPSIIVQAAASTENLASGMRLLHSSIIWPIDHRGFEAPVILAVSRLESPGRGHDHVDLSRIGWPSLDDCNGDVGVLSQTASDNVTGSAA
jgi:hypothetical protein